MGSYVEKEEVKKALAKAKELEKNPEPVPSRQKEVDLYKDMISLSEKMKSMLKSSWFVKDTHKATHAPIQGKYTKKSAKKAKNVVARKSAAKKKR